MDRKDLIGAWTLSSVTRHLEDGRTVEGYGPDPQGLLIYTADGMMSAQMMKSGRASFSAPRESSLQVERGDPHEIVSAFNSYVAYSGRFTFDAGAGEVRHHIDVALAPDMIGRTIVRKAERSGDDLVLHAPSLTYEGVKSDVVVRWSRADAAAATHGSNAASPYAVMRRFLDALVARDLDVLADLHSEDVVLEYPFAPDGHPSQIEGHAAVLNLFAQSFAAKHPRAYTDLRVMPTADGTAAVVEFKGELALVSTGEVYHNSYFALVKFDRGRIALFREYYDAAIRAAKDPMRAKELHSQKLEA